MRGLKEPAEGEVPDFCLGTGNQGKEIDFQLYPVANQVVFDRRAKEG